MKHYEILDSVIPEISEDFHDVLEVFWDSMPKDGFPLFSGISEEAIIEIRKIVEEQLEWFNAISELSVDKCAQLEDKEEEQQPGRRGRSVIKRLLGYCDNKEVCRWYDIVKRKLKRFFSNLTQQLCCFFLALFEVVEESDGYQKVACYYRLMKEHIREKIPNLRTLQREIKWFTEWRKGYSLWTHPQQEEQKHSLWTKLKMRIKNVLLEIISEQDPEFAFA